MDNERQGAEAAGTPTPGTPAPGATDEQVSDEEKNGDDEVTISKEELEKLQKKSTDFDGIIEKQRLAKLHQRENPQGGGDGGGDVDVAEIARQEAQKAIHEANRPVYEENLKEAYTDLIKEHPWVNDDVVIDELKKHFKPEGHITKSHLLARLKHAVERAYPERYEQSREDAIRRRISAERDTAGAGEVAGSGSSQHSAGDEQPKKVDPETGRFFDAMGVPKEKRA